MSSIDRLIANAATPAEIVTTLDQISKGRALDQTESLFLERAILLEAGKPIPHGLTKALTRRGVKRDRRINMDRR